MYHVACKGKIFGRRRTMSYTCTKFYLLRYEICNGRAYPWPRGLLAWLWSGWIEYVGVQHFSRSVTISFLCFTTNAWWPGTGFSLSRPLWSLHSCGCTHSLQAKNSNGTTMRTFSNFNLLRGRCMLLPFPSTLTSLLGEPIELWNKSEMSG